LKRTLSGLPSSSCDVPNPKPAYVKVALQAERRTQAWLLSRRRRGPLWESGVRIFCYHRIAAARGDLAVAPEDFRRHIELLASFDAAVVPLTDAVSVLTQGRRGRFVCLTFDDGYRDFEEAALPVLREAGFPATLFVTTGFASGTVRMSWFRRRQPPLLGWADLKQLAKDDLVELGAHTRTHRALPRLSDADAREEIESPRHEIAARTGARVDAFAYPAGLYTSRERELVAGTGYDLAVTTDAGVNNPATSRFALRRTLVEGRDRVSLFEAKLLGRLDEPWEVRRWLRRQGAAGGSV
jgi:peptidoglycan/xylan/chitin deacetylase (PgdA/CDA1 family)